MEKVNLGGGRQSYEHPGYVSVDRIKSDGVNIVWDLESGLPKKFIHDLVSSSGSYGPTYEVSVFPDDSVDEFLSKHCFEHVRNLLPLMDEIWDALKPDGTLHVMVPNGHHIRAAYSDPTHVRTFVPETFQYWTQESLNAYPYTDKAWRIHDGYPKVNGADDDWWEIEVKMSPVK